MTSVTRLDPDNLNGLQITLFPRFPLDQSNKQFEIPADMSGGEKSLLEKFL